MIKTFPKILIIFFAVFTSFALIGSEAKAETYTCKNGNICSGTYDSAQSPMPPYSNYCKDACPSGYQCVKYESSIGCVDQTRTAPAENKVFKPQVEIPGYIFNPADKTTGNIANLIKAIYKYAIGIVGILAAVVLMIGGVLWIVAGGNATAIGEAKSWIGASLTGLILALTSYLILATINPALVDLKTTEIQKVEPAPGNGTGTSCCLGGDNNVVYYFDCKNVSKNDECKTAQFSTGVTRVQFVENKNCNQLGVNSWGCK